MPPNRSCFLWGGLSLQDLRCCVSLSVIEPNTQHVEQHMWRVIFVSFIPGICSILLFLLTFLRQIASVNKGIKQAGSQNCPRLPSSGLQVSLKPAGGSLIDGREPPRSWRVMTISLQTNNSQTQFHFCCACFLCPCYVLFTVWFHCKSLLKTPWARSFHASLHVVRKANRQDCHRRHIQEQTPVWLNKSTSDFFIFYFFLYFFFLLSLKPIRSHCLLQWPPKYLQMYDLIVVRYIFVFESLLADLLQLGREFFLLLLVSQETPPQLGV